MSKVFTGTTTIQEHIEQLGVDGWIPHDERKQATNELLDNIVMTSAPRKQSLEIRRLKQEAGLA